MAEAAGSLKGIYQRLRLFRASRVLKKELRMNIQDKYKKEPFYNELDSFLSRKKIFITLYNAAHKGSLNCKNTIAQTSTYYSHLFVEEYPNYCYRRSDIEWIVNTIYQISFSVLNDYSGDETIRKIVLNMERLSGGIQDDIADLRNIVTDGFEDVKKMQISNAIDTDLEPEAVFDLYINEYLGGCKKLFESYSTDFEYIERKIFRASDGKSTCIESVLKEQKIVILGEAGYGKTFESRKLVYDLADSYEKNGIIPVYLPLIEYGKLYDSVAEGVNTKFEYLFGNLAGEIVAMLSKNERLVYVLDGVDDIMDSQLRDKCILEVNNLMVYGGCNRFCILSRSNRYHNEFGKIKLFNLVEIPTDSIRNILREYDVYRDISTSIYELFENPLMLKCGIKVLTANSNSIFFNKSELFEALLLTYLVSWVEEKGGDKRPSTNIHDLLLVLGEYAFKTFDNQTMKYIEYEKLMHEICDESGQSNNIILYLVNTGLFNMNDGICFVHKTFKEYLAAFYILNKDLIYMKYINLDEWKEVFIFLSGMMNSLEKQDVFFDKILNANLELYISCVIGMKEQSREINSLSIDAYNQRFLRQLYNTYTTVIKLYFEELIEQFDPSIGLAETEHSAEGIRLIGNLSEDKRYIHYFYDRVEMIDENVLLCDDKAFKEYLNEREMNAVKFRRVIKATGTDLHLSGINQDGARLVALRDIKKELESLLKKNSIHESIYVKCEKIRETKNKIKGLKEVNSLKEIEVWLTKKISDAHQRVGNAVLVGVNHDNVELLDLLYYVKSVSEENGSLTDYTLPGMDSFPEGKTNWTWDFYSQERQIEICKKFFYWHQLSYIEMVERNFPKIAKYFQRYNDTPYQNIVYLGVDENKEDRLSEPGVEYYYIASTIQTPKTPKVIVSDKKNAVDFYEAINEISNSYKTAGKEARRLTISRTGFMHLIRSRSMRANTPLADEAYKSISEDIKSLFKEV